MRETQLRTETRDPRRPTRAHRLETHSSELELTPELLNEWQEPESELSSNVIPFRPAVSSNRGAFRAPRWASSRSAVR